MAKIAKKEEEMLLTDRDRELIILQCELQGATRPEQIEGFTRAYLVARDFADSAPKLTEEWALALIQQLGNLTEPKTASKYRLVPAIFGNGKKGADHREIPRLMDQLVAAFVIGEISPEETYRQFEQIHPFEDGNGRVGHLLWAIAVQRRSGSWPQELPLDLFNSSFPRKYESAFGEVEI